MNNNEGSVLVGVVPCNQEGGLAAGSHPVHMATTTPSNESDDTLRRGSSSVPSSTLFKNVWHYPSEGDLKDQFEGCTRLLTEEELEDNPNQGLDNIHNLGRALAEGQSKSFHCKTADCKGWSVAI